MPKGATINNLLACRTGQTVDGRTVTHQLLSDIQKYSSEI